MKDGDRHGVPDTEAGENGEPDAFLLRWARRKARAERDSSTDGKGVKAIDESGDESVDGEARRPSTESEQAGPDAPDRVEADETEAEKGDEDMPPLDSIDQGGSVADFFSSKVSPALRQAALRRLFGQSTLPVGDDLDDYAEDYTKFTKLGDIVTTEMRHRMEVVRKRLLERNPEAGPADAAAGDDPELASAAEPDTPAVEEEQVSRSDGDQIAEDDAEHRGDDTNIT